MDYKENFSFRNICMQLYEKENTQTDTEYILMFKGLPWIRLLQIILKFWQNPFKNALKIKKSVKNVLKNLLNPQCGVEVFSLFQSIFI